MGFSKGSFLVSCEYPSTDARVHLWSGLKTKQKMNINGRKKWHNLKRCMIFLCGFMDTLFLDVLVRKEKRGDKEKDLNENHQRKVFPFTRVKNFFMEKILVVLWEECKIIGFQLF